MEMKVHIISRETIKPSSPTPHHLRTHKLSLFDQLAPPLYIPILLFYSATSETNPSKKSDLLKDSLSKILTHFYPFAGRVKEGCTIDCNDDGAAYVEAQVDSDMFLVLKEPGIDLLLQLLPCEPLEKLPEPSAQVILAVQVNYFACGGMAICVCLRHVVSDASAAAGFVKSWAAVASGVDMVLDAVIYDCTSLFPPQDLSGLWKTIEKSQNALLAEVVTKRFIFYGSKIAALRNEIGNGLSLYRPTRVEALSSLIWNAIIACDTEEGEIVPMHVATTAVNLRKRMNPPLPQLCMGNISHVTMANLFMARTKSRNSLAEKIHESILKMDDKFVRQFFGSGAHLNVMKNMAAELGKSSKARLFNFSSWCRFPFYETDFGWGKPVWFATALRLNKLAIFLDTRDGKGIEAWIGLTKEEMTKLERDPGILAYASFNPSI
ncbi:PREDICTED: salutaridinol 7-O-acetyltransferase [Theobroma cacao]|uniref:Salutaridinol 7-O-acetyltransferase n=1 Tax=Theobroma cacao TaxID=3641 RepID=A0AB32W395_THECC|nr:PREDICTED: salutaridinol 7-O-acetyltransferase [Theobroma cacao]